MNPDMEYDRMMFYGSHLFVVLGYLYMGEIISFQRIITIIRHFCRAKKEEKLTKLLLKFIFRKKNKHLHFSDDGQRANKVYIVFDAMKPTQVT